MLVHFGIGRSRFKTPDGASVATLAEYATQALSGHVKNSDDQQFVCESLRTHIPEYVFELYRQTAPDSCLQIVRRIWPHCSLM